MPGNLISITNLMSGHEAKLYEQQTSKTNGWTGWRPFILGKRSRIRDHVFHLYPSDGGKVTPHLPGQYLSIRTFLNP
ncbi:hypothetical protein CS542_08525 [Pedobacter sp. IW39]|nr:hypothetical protein CS542_08525 [Pedobacter sp. IW39]